MTNFGVGGTLPVGQPAPLAGLENSRVAWLLPTIRSGPYWQPFLAEFARLFPRTTVFTSGWGGYLAGYEDAFKVRVLGEHRHVRWAIGKARDPGYEGLNWVPASVFGELRRQRPEVVFTSAFGLWTLLALAYRGMERTRVVVVLDGIAESCAYRHSPRIVLRRAMARRIDAAVSNSEAGCAYLRDELHVKPSGVFHRRFYVPAVRALQGAEAPPAPSGTAPGFLFVGQIIPRKGWRSLLEACRLLRERGKKDFTLTMAGDGPEMSQLRARIQELGLTSNVTVTGRVPYARLGSYFAAADVFVLPSFEDTWGMVISEAMALGKAVLCSRYAGASELIRDGREGYVFDPHDPASLAGYMERLLDSPSRAREMGEQARHAMVAQTPVNAARELGEIAAWALRQY